MQNVSVEESRHRIAEAMRHNQALVALGRRVWGEDCTFETALAQICETAASTLDVDRVNVWALDREAHCLRCVHGYVRKGRRHNPPGYAETLDFDSEYGAQLEQVRIIDVDDVCNDDMIHASLSALGEYLTRHDIRSLLDAPVRGEGKLYGVVCHEQVGRKREWSPEDEAFAASIGDYVSTAYAIARRRKMQDRLRYLQRHDALTDLPNRDHLLEVARDALRPMRGDDPGVAVIHIQLDADERTREDDGVLIGIADCLRDALGDEATLARVRSDAFAVLSHRRMSEAEALNIAEAYMQQVQMHYREVLPRVGIAFSRDLPAPSADSLLRNAEHASLRAREAGQPQCEIFDSQRHRQLVDRLRVEQTLRDALDQQRFCLYYQPEVHLANGGISAAEALLRMRDDDGAIVAAGEFIEVAEHSGLILPLGRWVLRQACIDAAAWATGNGHAAPMLRVNVSARQFEQACFADEVTAALEHAGLPPQRLCLELTETVLLRQPDVAAGIIARLRALGVTIALDDFGTGFSSLTYLRHLTIDVIKLDRSFVGGLPASTYDLAIVDGITHIATRLGIDVVAEGVERQDQLDLLRDMGVQRMQGWLFDPALPDADFRSRLAAH